jgi:hypothetical protein
MQPPLEKSLRNKLERTVKDARDVAETAARSALQQLGVGEAVLYSHLSEADRELRRRLRVHGRQLGDIRNAKTEIQEIERLTEEVAYEHWHRMLFARFLAENNLLMYWAEGDNEPIDIDLDACQGLIDDGEEQAGSKWELAARLATRMLPQIFRPDSPVFQLVLPPEHELKLERLVADLPQEVFTASDSLGWVYQFWQAKRKDEVNASEVKIGAREISAVTQLFTEPYMVAFLLDNSLGAWWVAKVAGLREGQKELRPGAREILRTAKTEEELRKFFSLPGVPLEYLRCVKQDDGEWLPASGTFDGWPEVVGKLKILDPCCGSGHFLVVAFLMLVAMRMELDGLSPQGAVDAVLHENIHGLELDQRCVELAAFALALTAWRYPSAGGYRSLPQLHLACTGFSISSSREQWMAILEGQNLGTNLRFFFGQLYDLFKKAPTLGSLINPHRYLGSALLDGKGMDSLYRALESAVQADPSSASERHELGVTAKGLATATELLAGRYALVATNVPYLGRGKQDDVLKEYLEEQYPLGKADLATAFLLRCLEFCAEGGTTALVTPQNWLFLATYTKLRQMLLYNRSWDAVARLGHGAFETISGQVVNVALPMLSVVPPVEDQRFAGIDVSVGNNIEEKAAMLRGEKAISIVLLSQEELINNPESRITLEEGNNTPSSRMGEFVTISQGSSTGDDDRFTRCFWECFNDERWRYFMTSPDKGPFSGRSKCWDWPSDTCELSQLSGARIQGFEAVGKIGFAVAASGRVFVAPYFGNYYNKALASIIPRSPVNSPALWSFLESGQFEREARKLDQKLLITPGTFKGVPFDLAHWQKVADEKYPNGLPEPESNDPTQWLFHGRPDQSIVPLQIAAARLLGYRWPAELDSTMRLSKQSRDLAKSCEELFPFADEDGIVCIPAVRGEASAADRLLNLLAKAYGTTWTTDILGNLLTEVGFTGKGLDLWLRDGFFAQHCELFHQRPFIWHIWDGLRDGFAALVNYHKLDFKALETLIYTYLGDWIARQRQDQSHGVDGAEEKLAAAEQLKKRLEMILEGEAPYDIFVRWKPIDKQPIGWQPDLNDGVRLNIRPFITVPDVKVKGAGVLRIKPKIKWEKDRGKEPRRPKQDFPWFWGWDGSTDFTGGTTFTGDRHNDCHYSLDFKRDNRRQAGKE